MFLQDPDKGRALLHQKLLYYSNELSSEIGLPLRLDSDGINEAFDAALSSSQFHQIHVTKLSHFKELAHIGFWVAELKPITIKPPPRPDYFLHAARVALFDVVFGPSASPFSKVKAKYRDALKAYKARSTYAVSEFIALQLINDVLEAETLLKIKDEIRPAEKKLAEERLENFKAMLKGQGVFINIVTALRYHIFTPRSFATLVESVFSFS